MNRLYKTYMHQIHLRIIRRHFPEAAIKLVDILRIHRNHAQQAQIRLIFCEMMVKRCESLCTEAVQTTHVDRQYLAAGQPDQLPSNRRIGFLSNTHRIALEADLDRIKYMLVSTVEISLRKMMEKVQHDCGVPDSHHLASTGTPGVQLGGGIYKVINRITPEVMTLLGFLWAVMSSKIMTRDHDLLVDVECWLAQVQIADDWFEAWVTKELEKESTGDAAVKALELGHLFVAFEEILTSTLVATLTYIGVPIPEDPMADTLFQGLTTLKQFQKQVIWFQIQLWDMLLGWVERVYASYIGSIPVMLWPILPQPKYCYTSYGFDSTARHIPSGAISFSYAELSNELKSLELVGKLFMEIGKIPGHDRGKSQRWIGLWAWGSEDHPLAGTDGAPWNGERAGFK
ncbi:hypothetical protein BJ508DRAFT_326923 [Ascobolus immersus RN42]|uniref:Uncharacterized protein n=1 Tax=Ascobolus immersus RN42 TaxID=1160509 RepID=A0A3N4I475_ASCIM|nr:hypothetical protein BJ508DRAFT_326923 [Ascobolus immersus RN42]